MNKILRNFFVAAMAIMSVSAMAQTTVTFDGSVDKGTKTASDPGEDQITKDGVTIAVSNGAMNLTDQYRCYKNATFTVTSTVGNITKVEISCTAEGDAKYGPGCFTGATAGAYAFEGSVGTWTGDADTFTMTASLNQVRMNTVVVTLAAGAQEQSKVWDFTILPTQAIDGTGNIETNAEGGVFTPGNEDTNWQAFYNNVAIEGAEFMATATQVLEMTKGLKWYINGAKKVYYRNYPESNQGGKYIFINDGDNATEVCIPAKAGQQIVLVGSTAKNNKKVTSDDVAETFETSDGETLHGVVIDGTTKFDWKEYTLTVTRDNPFLKFEKNMCIQNITVKDAGSTPAEQGKSWDFTKWSDATVANLKADAAASKTEGWSDVEKKADAEAGADPTEASKDNCFWSVAEPNADGEMSANGVVIAELKGLKFYSVYSTARSLAIAVNYPSTSLGDYAGGAYLWLGGGKKKVPCFAIPSVAAGSTITMEVESHKPAEGRGVELYTGLSEDGKTVDDATKIGDSFTPTAKESHSWEIANDCDVIVYNTNGCHIYTIKVETGTTAINTVKATTKKSDAIYNLAGQKVGKDYKGIVIMNGKKYMQK